MTKILNTIISVFKLETKSFCFWSVLLLLTEKAMAPHSSTLAWKIPWTEEPGRLQSMMSLGVGHDWATSLSLFTFMHWRRKWQPTPVFLPGESQGQRSLVGCHLCGCTGLDRTEVTWQQQQLLLIVKKRHELLQIYEFNHKWIFWKGYTLRFSQTFQKENSEYKRQITFYSFE